MHSKKNPHIFVPAWLFVAFMAVYGEFLLHIWTTKPIDWTNLLVVGCFALAFGSLLGFLTSLLPPKAQKWTAGVLAFLLSVLYLMEYFMDDAYQVFMPLSVVLAGAEGVATGFLSTVLALLAVNWWRILLFLAPIALFLIFSVPGKSSRKLRVILAAATAVLYILCVLVINLFPGYGARMTTAYEFDSAVTALGLNVALPLDILHSSGAGQEPSFQIPDVPQTTPPTQLPEETEAEHTDSTQETEAPTEPPVVYGENALPLDFALLAETEKNGNIRPIHAYVASQTPTMENEFTGIFKGKNLILITAEAFTAEVIDPELTPTLYRMANQGIRFEEYYQPVWGAGTTGGEYSNVVGLVPNGGGCMRETLQQDLFLTMGNQLQKLGYSSAAYHPNDYTYYSRHQTHTLLGYDYFMGYGNGIEEGITLQWPESDLEMFEFTIPKHLDQQPFSLYYMSVSGHSSYSEKYNDIARKNYDQVKDLPYSYPVKCYLAANLELEYAMAYLIEQLEAAGIADDTVVVIASDHYPYGLEASATWGTSMEYISELFGASASDPFVRDHNALIIWSGCLEGQNIVVEDPVYSLDILPTLSNLFGVEFDSRLLVGRDVFSEAEPLVLWKTYSWITDKGSYDSSKGIFTPREGITVDEDYVARINAIVKNKLTFSNSVVAFDYYNYVVRELEKVQTTEPAA